MIIKIGEFEFTECWDGVLYKRLSDYPRITDWEIQTILDFERYEKKHGRDCDIEATDEILRTIEEYRSVYESGVRVSVPKRITECTACPKYKGCMTDLVCHTSPIENAVKIIDCGSLLSPVRARGLSAAELKAEARNAANDPEDYFDYIMFAWGNCQAGDRLVMERRLGRFPSDEELCGDSFIPGVRFFFRYEKLAKHPDAVFEGVLPMKVKDEVRLSDWVDAVIVPTSFESVVRPHIKNDIADKVYFVENNCKDIWEWSEKVYEFAKTIA